MQACCNSRDKGTGVSGPPMSPRQNTLDSHGSTVSTSKGDFVAAEAIASTIPKLPIPDKDQKLQGNDVQVLELKSQLDAQKKEHFNLAKLVQTLQSRLSSIDSSTLELLRKSVSNAESLRNFEGRLNDFQQRLPEKQDEQEKLLQSREVPSSQDNEALHLHKQLTSQIDELQGKASELSRWRSKVDAQLEALQSEFDKLSNISLPAVQSGLKEALDAISREPQMACSPPPEPQQSHDAAKSSMEQAQQDVQDTQDIIVEGVSRFNILGLQAPAKKFDNEIVFSFFNLHREYVWQESVYDGFFMVGLEFLTTAHNLALLCGFLLNFVMILLIIGILSSDSFAQKPFQDWSSLKQWRDSEAHSTLYFNQVTSMTLATRVCALDDSLSIASDQKILLSDIENYLGEVIGIPHQGRVLCSLAIAAWVLCCALEMRNTINFFLAIHSLPRRMTSVCVHVDGFEFCSFSLQRVLVGSFVSAFRFVFACLLLWHGSKWLAFTTSISDLLLNSSALSFVLDNDDTIFGVVAPYRVSGMMRSLAPIRLPPTKWLTLVPVSLMSFTAILVVLANTEIINDITSAMDEVQQILCEPTEQRNILVGSHALGWPTYTETTAWDGKSAVPVSHYETVVNQLVHGDARARYAGYKVGSPDALLQLNSLDTANWVNMDEFGCSDLNGLDRQDPRLGIRLAAAVGNVSLRSLSGCEDAKVYCRDSSVLGINVRFMCACTCGCAGVYSGLWDLAESMNGCPQELCLNNVRRVLTGETGGSLCQGDGFQGASCEDQDLDHLNAGHWPWMLERMSALHDIGEGAYNNLTNLGCGAMPYLSINARAHICSTYEDFKKFGAAPFCPESCGCKRHCAGMCPQTCCQ